MCFSEEVNLSTFLLEQYLAYTIGRPMDKIIM